MYVGCNPISKFDPDGREEKRPIFELPEEFKLTDAEQKALQDLVDARVSRNDEAAQQAEKRLQEAGKQRNAPPTAPKPSTDPYENLINLGPDEKGVLQFERAKQLAEQAREAAKPPPPPELQEGAFEKSFINHLANIPLSFYRSFSPDNPAWKIQLPYPEAPSVNPFLLGLELLAPLAIETGAPRLALRAPSLATAGAELATRAAPDAAEILARLVAKHYQALVDDPSLAANYLSRAEQLAGPRFNAANFGKALERAVGADVQENYADILRYVGGKSNPDFVGVGAAEGRTFDITTFAGQESHYARPYGDNLELILYDVPQGWP